MGEAGGHPQAAVLLAAVRAFLEEARAALDGRMAFHARIAANVLAIVERELTAPDAADPLAPWGGAGAVCAGLRDGRLDPEDRALLAAMREDVLAKLAIDNPRYATLLRLGARGID